MQVRKFDSQLDYKDVAQWWVKQGWPPMPVEILSKVGFMAEQENSKLAATWMYATDSKLFIMEWTVGNPDVDWKLRNEGISQVVHEACSWAKANGALTVITTTKHARLISKFEESGFTKTDSEMTHLIRGL